MPVARDSADDVWQTLIVRRMNQSVMVAQQVSNVGADAEPFPPFVDLGHAPEEFLYPLAIARSLRPPARSRQPS